MLQMRSACAKFTCLYFHSICMLYSDRNLALITAYYDFIKRFSVIFTKTVDVVHKVYNFDTRY